MNYALKLQSNHFLINLKKMGGNQGKLIQRSATFPPRPLYLSAPEKKALIAQYPDKVLDGNALAARIKADLKKHIELNTVKRNSRPVLGHIIVGDLA